MKACCLASIFSRMLELVKIKMKNEIQMPRKIIRNSSDKLTKNNNNDINSEEK